MSALYSESTLAIGFPSEDQGVVLPCVEMEIRPLDIVSGREVEMMGFIQGEGVGRIQVTLRINTNNHKLLSALSYDNMHVEITVAKKEAQ